MAYLDDVIVFSETWEDHVQHLALVLERLATHHLTVAPLKCHIGASEVEFLGHVVDAAGNRPQPSHLQKIAEAEVPRTRKQLQRFIGLVNWLRSYSRKARRRDGEEQQQPREPTTAFQTLALDVMGPYPRTPRGHRFILVVTDLFTCWTEAYPCRNVRAATITKILSTEFLPRWGYPQTMPSGTNTSQTHSFVSGAGRTPPPV
ncbi:uncharacterized protein LOC134535688 [Bacillus rossius redtenbacheri]|uniref:uncharacterized protein LOC134535688 n=1 Tax=Bacillus rossius redtenbacheri TaxID=93214 RepID=UPI002FDD45DC